MPTQCVNHAEGMRGGWAANGTIKIYRASDVLGIEINLMEGELRLPSEKLHQLKDTLMWWRGLKACRKRDLLSLIGSLSHATKVIRAGRIFLHRLINLSMTATQMEHFIRLNVEAWLDIEWWFHYILPWNGKMILTSHINQPEATAVYTDASETWGCGAIWGPHWLQLEWAGLWQDAHILTKELAPIVIAAVIWGHAWRGKAVRILSDNSTAVAAINNQSSRVMEMAHLLLVKCLAFISGASRYSYQQRMFPGA